jgi:hypothetical protein
MTLDGFKLVIVLVEHLQIATTSNDCALTVLRASQITIGHISSSQSVTFFTSRCLVAASNGRRSSSSGFANYIRPQLPVSHNNSSKQLNPSGYLRVRFRLTLWLTVYRQLLCLGAKPLEDHDQIFFLQLNSCGHCPYVTFSLTRRWVCLLWIGFAFVESTYRTYSMLLKIISCASPLSVQALQSRSRLSYISYVPTAAKSLERS